MHQFQHESLSIAQYRQLVEVKVNELTASNPVIQKMRVGHSVSDEEAESPHNFTTNIRTSHCSVCAASTIINASIEWHD
jgi:hypothetical protein